MGLADYVNDDLLSETERVERRRYREALDAGLTDEEARVFAIDTGISVSELRQLIRKGCPPRELARILL